MKKDLETNLKYIDKKIILEAWNDELTKSKKDLALYDLKLDYLSMMYSESGNKDNKILNSIVNAKTSIDNLKPYIKFIYEMIESIEMGK